MADIRYTDLVGTPFGNTANRPASPSIGQTYNNGTTGILEIYTESGWIGLAGAPPVPPTSVIATDIGTSRATNSASASVEFTAGTGGGLSLDYILTSSPATTQLTSSSSPITITGLTGGTSYTYTVQGRNNFGTSSSSAASSSVVATSVPYPPTSVTASTTSNTDIALSWSLGANGGKSLTGQTVIAYLGASEASTSNVSASATSATISGLTSGSTYTFKVKATNANGTSVESSASNSILVPSLIQVDYLVIASGGTGGNRSYRGPGGGGAGGLRSTVTATGGGGTLETPKQLYPGTNYQVTVGAGSTNNASNGNNSSFSDIVSTAGGGGAYSTLGGNGGSGGGAGGGNGVQTGGTAVTNQGYPGGNYTSGNNSPGCPGAGGGGAGAAGGNSSGTGTGGAGGAGVAVSITGSSVTYAGGGGGGGGSGAGSGGSGGGGAGNGSNGAANTGSGGGGISQDPGTVYGIGGSGVVILRYTNAKTITIGAGLTGSTVTSGIYKVTTITAGTGNVSWT